MTDGAGQRPGLVLRSMTLADIPQVLLIERRSFSTPWQEPTFRGLLRRRSASLLVAEDASRIVGYAALWYVADEAELGDLAVLPEVRGQGLGRWILDRALAEAGQRGAVQVFLEVRASNEEARRLYTKAGFDTVGVRPSYYSEPVEDAILMRRSVDTEDSR